SASPTPAGTECRSCATSRDVHSRWPGSRASSATRARMRSWTTSPRRTPPASTGCPVSVLSCYRGCRPPAGHEVRVNLARLAVPVVVLATAVTAFAANGREQIKLNAHDNALARAVVVKRTDLGPSGWKGGMVKADLSPPPT